MYEYIDSLHNFFTLKYITSFEKPFFYCLLQDPYIVFSISTINWGKCSLFGKVLILASSGTNSFLAVDTIDNNSGYTAQTF